MSCISFRVVQLWRFVFRCDSGCIVGRPSMTCMKVRKWGEREEQREEVLRHCARSRRSADAGDSLAAVISPPYRQCLSDTFCRQSSATHSVCVFESLSDNMDTDKCAAQPWRERGNVLTTSDLHCGRVCMEFIWDLELCEVLVASEHLTAHAGSSSKWLSCSPLILLTRRCKVLALSMGRFGGPLNCFLVEGRSNVISWFNGWPQCWRYVKGLDLSQTTCVSSGLKTTQVFSTFSTLISLSKFENSFMSTNELKALLVDASFGTVRVFWIVNVVNRLLFYTKIVVMCSGATVISVFKSKWTADKVKHCFCFSKCQISSKHVWTAIRWSGVGFAQKDDGFNCASWVAHLLNGINEFLVHSNFFANCRWKYWSFIGEVSARILCITESLFLVSGCLNNLFHAD